MDGVAFGLAGHVSAAWAISSTLPPPASGTRRALLPPQYDRLPSVSIRPAPRVAVAVAAAFALVAVLAFSPPARGATAPAGDVAMDDYVPACPLAGAPPTNTSPPTVAGAEREGETLTATPGTWCPDAVVAYEYHWQRCSAGGGECADIPGAVAGRYTLAGPDVGHRIRVRVTATNPSGTGQATSDPTGPIGARGGVPAGGPVDTLAPRLRVRVARQRLRTVARRGLAVSVRCSEACDVHALLLLSPKTARTLKLSRSRYPLVVGAGFGRSTGQTAKVAVRLTTTRVRRALMRVGSVRLGLKTFALDAAANVSADSRRITLRR